VSHLSWLRELSCLRSAVLLLLLPCRKIAPLVGVILLAALAPAGPPPRYDEVCLSWSVLVGKPVGRTDRLVGSICVEPTGRPAGPENCAPGVRVRWLFLSRLPPARSHTRGARWSGSPSVLHV
jgi:hypothetical protein